MFCERGQNFYFYVTHDLAFAFYVKRDCLLFSVKFSSFSFLLDAGSS